MKLDILCSAWFTESTPRITFTANNVDWKSKVRDCTLILLGMKSGFYFIIQKIHFYLKDSANSGQTHPVLLFHSLILHVSDVFILIYSISLLCLRVRTNELYVKHSLLNHNPAALKQSMPMWIRAGRQEINRKRYNSLPSLISFILHVTYIHVRGNMHQRRALLGPPGDVLSTHYLFYL